MMTGSTRFASRHALAVAIGIATLLAPPARLNAQGSVTASQANARTTTSLYEAFVRRAAFINSNNPAARYRGFPEGVTVTACVSL
jgi:hypothetical protein